jgi:Leucine-rich repeat (LRR) protein
MYQNTDLINLFWLSHMKRGPIRNKQPLAKRTTQEHSKKSFLKAAEEGKLDALKELIPFVAIDSTNEHGETALILAIKYAPQDMQLPITNLLLNNGADLSIISKRQMTAVGYAKLHNKSVYSRLAQATFNETKLLPEIWELIAQYFDQEDLNNFRSVCVAFKQLNNQNDHLLWQPFLNRLHAIEPTISVTPDNNQTAHEAFILRLKKVEQRQLKEIFYLRSCFESLCSGLGIGLQNPGVQRCVKIFKEIEDEIEKPLKLSNLEQRSMLLDRLNCDFIQLQIHNLYGLPEALYLNSVTRFPSRIINENADYFSKLQLLNISGKLSLLPENIDICQKLGTLICEHNGLVRLPENLTNITSLQRISLIHNKIKRIPANLNKFVNLHSLDLSHNYLTTLPSDVLLLSERGIIFNANKNLIGELPEAFQLWETTGYYQKFLKNQRVLRNEEIPEYEKAVDEVLKLGKVTLQESADVDHENLITIAKDARDNNLELIEQGIEKAIKANSTHLNLRHLKLTYMPDDIDELGDFDEFFSNLRSLDCSYNLLTILPAELISRCEKLETLICNNNQLEALPECLSQLTHLTLLNCADNKLTVAPKTSASEVILRRNYIQRLPDNYNEQYGVDNAREFLITQRRSKPKHQEPSLSMDINMPASFKAARI